MYGLFNCLPYELLSIIFNKLNHCSLAKMSVTCSEAYQLCKPLLDNYKLELFQKHTVFSEKFNVTFVPGPSIKHLLNRYRSHQVSFRMNGIYFFHNDVHDPINFFFLKKHFLKKFKVASIKSKKKNIHKHDIGCYNIQKGDWGHWNDLDADYIDLFKEGKRITKQFWKELNK